MQGSKQRKSGREGFLEIGRCWDGSNTKILSQRTPLQENRRGGRDSWRSTSGIAVLFGTEEALVRKREERDS